MKKNDVFTIGDQIQSLAAELLDKFNEKDIKLTDLKPHQRIFIFFYTRAFKTTKAIGILAKEGYGQDASTLVRGLLENLISVKYVFFDPLKADQKAARLVDYKWVIFKRYISNDKKTPSLIKDDFRRELVSKNEEILKQVDAFRKRYGIKSDRALISWSGRSLRDMAKMVSPKLVEEYDTTFRQASRFSHPSILGDSEYLHFSTNQMNFSPFPTSVGVYSKYRTALIYFLDYLEIFNSLFNLFSIDKIKELRHAIKSIPPSKPSPKKASAKSSLINKDSIVIKFQSDSQNEL